MIPKDAPQQDWAMYYHDTYMTHIEKGPCWITVQMNEDEEGGHKQLYMATISNRGNLNSRNPVDPDELRILWPRPGAYNFSKFRTAGFVGRKPQRHMKRSAYRDHYFVQWSPAGISTMNLMVTIAHNPGYWTVSKFLKEKDKTEGKRTNAAAISSKVILYQPKSSSDPYVIYLADDIGRLIKGQFVPHMEHDSRIPRILRHLSMIGLA